MQVHKRGHSSVPAYDNANCDTNFKSLPISETSWYTDCFTQGDEQTLQNLTSVRRLVEFHLSLKDACSFAGIAQLVEHCTENAGVPSSSLGPGTGNYLCGCSSVVERLLAKEKVVGSNPIARSE